MTEERLGILGGMLGEKLSLLCTRYGLLGDILSLMGGKISPIKWNIMPPTGLAGRVFSETKK